MRDRLLVRLFLWRFLDHDLISPNADRHVVLSAVGGGLAALSLFIAVLIAWMYQLSPEMPAGITSIRAVDDRFFFVTSSMLVMVLVAVIQWDALVLDERDAAVLGSLPLTRGLIVRTKFAATALLAATVLLTWNLFPTMFRLAMIPSGLRVGLADAFKLTLAHAFVTGAGGMFGFLTVLGLRESLFATLGAAGFRRMSAIVQATLIVTVVTSLLLLPGVHDMAARWRDREAIAARALPPSWFVGLHETLAGSLIDDLPHVRPMRFLIRREREATELYRSLWPLYHQLAMTALSAWSAVGILTVGACLWNSRRLPRAAGGPVARDSGIRRGSRWLAVHVVARTPLQQAGFFFTLQTLSRRISHRVAMASAWALGLALIVVAASGSQSETITGAIPMTVLMAQPLLLGTLMQGFRRATRLPSELRASSTFCLAWSGEAAAFISGVKRAGWIAVVLPALFGLAIWHTAVLGPRLAALHFGAGFATAAALMELMFLRCRALPFVSAAAPTVDVKLRLIGSLVALVSVSAALAAIERLSLGELLKYASFVGSLAVVSVAVALSDRVSRKPPLTFDVEEDILPTQRLNLAQ